MVFSTRRYCHTHMTKNHCNTTYQKFLTDIKAGFWILACDLYLIRSACRTTCEDKLFSLCHVVPRTRYNYRVSWIPTRCIIGQRDYYVTLTWKCKLKQEINKKIPLNKWNIFWFECISNYAYFECIYFDAACIFSIC